MIIEAKILEILYNTLSAGALTFKGKTPAEIEAEVRGMAELELDAHA